MAKAGSDPVVGAIAERALSAVLAATEEHLSVFLCSIAHRREFRSLVRAVTERLLGALAAGTPGVGPSSLHFGAIGGSLQNVWCRHYD